MSDQENLTGLATLGAEMLPGAGFVTGAQKGGSEGGLDVLSELIGIVGAVGGSAVAPGPGTVAGYVMGKGGTKAARNLISKYGDDVVEFVQKEFPKLRKDWWLDSKKDTVTLYHGTDVKNLNRIKKEGILPDDSNRVFLTPDPDTGLGYAAMTGGEKTFRKANNKAVNNPIENRRLLEIEVPKEIIEANINKQRSENSISKLLSPDARKKFTPYDKKENQPYYASTEFSIEGGIPPQYIKGVSSKVDPRKVTTTKKNQGGSVVERNPYSNYKLKVI